MDLDDIKQRYKVLPLWARLTVAGIIGLIPGIYVLMDEGDGLDARRMTAETEENAARTEFEKARENKANLPKLEEQLAFTEEQLAKAKKRLPDSYRIEDILQKAATIAKDTGVKLNGFIPQDETQHCDKARYIERPIKTEVEGRYSELVTFFDRIVHLDGSIFVQRIQMNRTELEENKLTNPFQNQDGRSEQKKTPFQLAREARQNVRIKASFDITIFRGISDGEGCDAPQNAQDPAATANQAATAKG